MSRTLTASDRSALIRLASGLPVGSRERRAILVLAARPRMPGETVKNLLEYREDAIAKADASLQDSLDYYAKQMLHWLKQGQYGPKVRAVEWVSSSWEDLSAYRIRVYADLTDSEAWGFVGHMESEYRLQRTGRPASGRVYAFRLTV